MDTPTDASTDNTQPDNSLKASAESPASSPASPAEAPDDFPPLTVIKLGDTVQIDRSPDERDEWRPEDFARLFLHWLASEYPVSRGTWVYVGDIEDEYLPRFQAAAECHFLEAGALQRGLGDVLGKTGKRERTYTDSTGKRRYKTEYRVPKAAFNVVDLAERREAT